ncbi:hypothetical protein I4U23_015817 [Adineta vaga]|nr:hypothetical protein I4U23_015817 [Adineta vaga]
MSLSSAASISVIPMISSDTPLSSNKTEVEYSPVVTASTDSSSSDLVQLPDVISSFDEYQLLYNLSIKDPDRFWKMAADRLTWYQPPTKIKDYEFDYRSSHGVDIKWFQDGVLNVCYNCLDRHIERDPTAAQQIALIFESDIPTAKFKNITYGQLLHQVKKVANVLKKHDVRKGDRVVIYMPMVAEVVIALLACTRIGAVHSVVFAAFSSKNLAERIVDSQAKVVITSDVSTRGGKCHVLKHKVDEALNDKRCSVVQTVFIFQRKYFASDGLNDFIQSDSMAWIDGRDFCMYAEMNLVDDECVNLSR